MIHQKLIDNSGICRYESFIHIFGNGFGGEAMSKTLTKADIISVIQTENGYSLKKSAELFETLLCIIKSTQASSEDVLVSGFGKFQVREKMNAEGGIRLLVRI